MQLPGSKTVVFGAAAVAAALVSATAQAALLDRDLNGDSVVDAFYDTDLDITWLRDANVAGKMNYWAGAVAWADSFSFAGYDDWRLPASDSCLGPNCTGSEMGHLWYVELGNVIGDSVNTGSFQNVQPWFYWSGSDDPNHPNAAMVFRMDTGYQSAFIKNSRPDFYAMAVADGDIGVPVPEPGTYALMLAGLGALGAMARRRARGRRSIARNEEATMQLPSINTVVFGAAAVAAALVSGAAQAALQDRDLDGNGEVDAFYDTDLDVTWLRNANVNGQMNWDSAVAWADGFTFAGYDDWRLPVSDSCGGFNCTGSEMGHLWYIELGNVAHSLTNTGNFQNLQANYYWSGTEQTSVAAWNFGVLNGAQQAINKVVVSYAMAVRPGDVPAVPEPQTYALLLAGLGVLGAIARRRKC